MPSSNHVEQMAMDMSALAAQMLPSVAERSHELRGPRFLDRLRAGAQLAWDAYGEDVFYEALTWESDTARGWAAFAVPFARGGPKRQLELAMRFAVDGHFAVREWAWLGLRPAVVLDPCLFLDLLLPHTADSSPLVRRFCSEVTRPRGVWSRHLEMFKQTPGLARPLLDSLVVAHERYVQDSVANWLNDAVRSQSRWVAETTARWELEHGDAVSYVCRRARRSGLI
jgi:3-methyladenine DNA glycosylase AlkC